jgi:hypothetical protein
MRSASATLSGMSPHTLLTSPTKVMKID